MARVKRGPHRKDKRKKVLKQAKGYYGKKSNAYRIAKQAVDRALRFAYRDRRQKKREFRSLWIVRINAASRENGLSYNRLISGLRKAGLDLNRKVLADIAVYDAEGFAAIVEVAKEAVADDSGVKVRPAAEKSPRPERVTAPARPHSKVKPKVKPKPKAAPAAEKAAKPPRAKPAPKPAKKAVAAAAEAAAKQDLEAMTVAQLQELAAKHGIAEGDIEGSGAAGKAVKADWIRVAAGLDGLTVSELEKLAEKRGIARGEVEGSGAGGNLVKADWVRALSGK